MSNNVVALESGRIQTLFHRTAKDQTCARRDHRNQVSSTLTFISPRVDPGVDKDGVGTGSDLPLSTSSVLVDQSSDIHKRGRDNMAQQNGDQSKEQLSFETMMPSRDRGPSDIHKHGRDSMVRQNGDQSNIRSSLQPETDDSVSVLCQDRRPPFTSRYGVPSDSDNRNKEPASQTEVLCKSVSRVPSADRLRRVPFVDDDITTCDGRRSRQRHHSQSRTDVEAISSGDHEQLILTENLEADITGTTVWSDDSPQHGRHLQSTQVCALGFMPVIEVPDPLAGFKMATSKAVEKERMLGRRREVSSGPHCYDRVYAYA